ncbi:enoyl-CoA hydratase [Rhodoblastus acidophilus]|uniref:3-hydroxyisobutyryl-CoA hydrolase n=1 Tax=Rhodoblastus acidophilus TaxID=1074 RepID=A0A212R4G6_RHOAC|nr:enoyl-CoA hydratase/isomerase family protein [Rhodoblastus acidophilus]PPQ36523.1 enoyl-CoA hydratase/isomerase family protein [Rhodoblastus acidophilus]RAI16930.1 enoyl-CoA hydratase/isomerase family protein [Rhodoblastus acidophilus]SNB66936.1 enoyl-CoA hydratase [Rhodoblastus acidophilus]
MTDEAEILLARHGRLGLITLNRPKAINALTLNMVRIMTRALTDWAADDHVGAVLIRGAGERGLCAGGDIVAIYNAAKSGDPAPVAFWREEYALNLMIADYSKPIVAVMHGVVMGGGVGISAHAAHRVVTEGSSVAMPEVGIGFIPDVGGTYLLSRAPGELGTHLALTAGRAGPADCLLLGLADLFIPQDRLSRLPDDLRDCGSHDQARAVLAALSAPAGPAPLADARGWIDAAYAADSVEAIAARLDGLPDLSAQAALELLRRHSPISLKVTLRALRKARALGALAPCLAMELKAATACLGGHDFPEGIRAAVIDKDRAPKWAPARLEDVGEDQVARYFA